MIHIIYLWLNNISQSKFWIYFLLIHYFIFIFLIKFFLYLYIYMLLLYTFFFVSQLGIRARLLQPPIFFCLVFSHFSSSKLHQHSGTHRQRTIRHPPTNHCFFSQSLHNRLFRLFFGISFFKKMAQPEVSQPIFITQDEFNYHL